ncbi:MAG: SsrA-binding protein SmpB [Planctomycetota bacterium]|nr:SsrA-binding protein SmpB [Planctomycetota bacterium]
MSRKKKDKKENPDPNKGERTISENRRARHKYEILEQVECGMVLRGSEVKSMREGKVSIQEAYGRVKKNELWLLGCDIPEFKQATIWNHEPRRPRKLLVHTRQLQKLTARATEKGLTLVPLKLYFNDRGIAKLLLGVCKGKKTHDKRESIKKADSDRRIERNMRRR